jgi:predicted  nucleic acid-binding Zn-ribbon protein
LVDGNKPEETSATHYRFRVAVDPNKTNELTIEEFHPELTQSMLTDLTQDQIDALVVENRTTPELQQAFRRVLDQKNQVYFVQSDIQSRQQELGAINKDQARIRENMKALKGSAEEKALLQRYTRQLASQEDSLNTLNKEIAELQKKQVAEQQKLDAMVQEIALDASF